MLVEEKQTVPSAVGRLLPSFKSSWQSLRQATQNVREFAGSRFHFFEGMNRLLSLFYESILHDTPVPIPYTEISARIANHGCDLLTGLSGETGMRILVTGAAGFLGRALIKRLLAHGYTNIRCNVRRQADIPKLDALLGRGAQTRLEYCVGNLRYREDAARAVDDVQLIFHLAAGKKGTAADLFLDSVVASRNLLDAVGNRKPLRIVLVSSFSVYGVAGLGRGAKVNEQTMLEPHPEWRDHYSFSKLRQEQLFWEYQRRNGFELVVLRPGVIYGPEGGHFSNRVGLTIGNWLLHFGGSNLLPLSYVDNCAEAVVFAGTHQRAAGQVYNVHDDDLPTCREYLHAYRKNVAKIRSISVPYFGVRLLSYLVVEIPSLFEGPVAGNPHTV